VHGRTSGQSLDRDGPDIALLTGRGHPACASTQVVPVKIAAPVVRPAGRAARMNPGPGQGLLAEPNRDQQPITLSNQVVERGH